MNASTAASGVLAVFVAATAFAASARAASGGVTIAGRSWPGSSGSESKLGSGVLVEDYGSATLRLDNGEVWATTSGIYDAHEVYNDKDLACVTLLDPPRAREVPVASNNFLTVLAAAFPGAEGWRYATAGVSLTPGALVVKTYDASARPAGAEFHVKYQPGGGDPAAIHWIQVVTSNHPSDLVLKAGHGVAENAVDIAAGQDNPYHHGPALGFNDDELGGYDFSWRLDSSNEHQWQAELWVVTGPGIGEGPGLITLHPPGIRWGWRNDCVEGRIEGGYLAAVVAPVTLATDGVFAPGAQRHVVATAPAAMRLSKGPDTARVELAHAQLAIVIGDALEFDHSGSRYTVLGGSGRFHSYIFADVPVGPSTFEVLGGDGTIHWSSGAIVTRLRLRVSADGFADILATADGTGAIDNSNKTVILDPDGLSVEIAGVPMLPRWGILVLVVVSAGAALFTLRGAHVGGVCTPLERGGDLQSRD